MNKTPEYDTIDLRQMFWFLMRKWKLFVIALLAGALLGAGITIVQGEKTVDSFDMEELDLEGVRQYVAYQQLYQDQLKRMQSSILLRMDPNAVYSGKMTCYLSAGYNTELMGMRFAALLDQRDIWEELEAASGLDCREQDVRELVNITYTRKDEPNVRLLSSDDPGSLPFSGVITISVTANTEESCEAMLGVLRERVAGMDAQYHETYGNYSFETVSDQVNFGYNSGVALAQKEAADLQGVYLNQIKALEKELGKDELEYYSLVYEPEKAQEKDMLSKLKYPVFLAVLFAFLMVGIWCMRFAVDDRIKAAVDVGEMYGVYLLAALPSGAKPRRGIDGWLDRQAQKGDLGANSREYLLTALDTLKKKNILLCGEPADGGVREVTAWLSGQNPALQARGFLQSDAHAQQAAAGCDGVVVFVRLWKTRRVELEREIEICRTHGIPLLGVVAIKAN